MGLENMHVQVHAFCFLSFGLLTICVMTLRRYHTVSQSSNTEMLLHPRFYRLALKQSSGQALLVFRANSRVS